MTHLRYLVLILVFFPSVTFGVVTAEIFPWALICAVFFLRPVPRAAVLPSIFLLAWLLLSAAYSTLASAESDSIRSLGAYLNPIAAFAVFIAMSRQWVDRSILLSRYILVFLLALGMLQFSGLIVQLETLLSFLVPRASGGLLEEMGARGVTLLSSEPSRAGVELVLLYVLFRLTTKPDPRLLFADLAMIGYLVFVIRAAQPMAFGVFAIGLLIIKRPSQSILLLLALLALPFISVDYGSSRALSLIDRLLAEGDLSNMLLFAVNESGHRLLTIYAFFSYGFTHPFGGGVGMWPVSSIDAINQSGFNVDLLRYFIVHGEGWVIAVRGSGFISNLMLDVGILGTILFFYWIFAMTKDYRLRDRNSFIIMTILLVKICFIGSVGEPLPWVIAALALRHNAALAMNARPRNNRRATRPSGAPRPVTGTTYA